jgi:hypothetical protein
VHIEIDPTGRPASAPGAKVDAGKVPLYRGLFDYFPLALAAIAEVSQVGAEKYSWKGWQDVPDGRARYSDAMLRHLAAESFGLLDDGPGGTGKRHDAQVAWNALARLELALRDPT